MFHWMVIALAASGSAVLAECPGHVSTLPGIELTRTEPFFANAYRLDAPRRTDRSAGDGAGWGSGGGLDDLRASAGSGGAGYEQRDAYLGLWRWHSEAGQAGQDGIWVTGVVLKIKMVRRCLPGG